MSKQVVVIAGPAGSGKNAIREEIVKRCPNTTRMTTATTRAPRPNEQNGIDYYFFSRERFEEELAQGNILEHYFRPETETYYGTYKEDIDQKLASGKVVLAQIQLVGAKYLKEHYNATTFFIMAPTLEAFEHRVRTRSPMSDLEWNERKAFTKREIEEESPWYDYRILNENGKLDEAVNHVIDILKKEGYNLGA